MVIQLLQPTEGDEAWRIQVHPKGGPDFQLSTAIALWTSTKVVVTLLRKMFPANSGVMIQAPNGEAIHPRPPGGYPTLHSSQPSKA